MSQRLRHAEGWKFSIQAVALQRRRQRGQRVVPAEAPKNAVTLHGTHVMFNGRHLTFTAPPGTARRQSTQSHSAALL
jgi:hypothetical protein